MKTALIAMLAALPLMVAASGNAEAKTRVQLYFGTPYYDTYMGPDYRHYPGRGWYKRDRGYNQQISCDRARNILRNNGYRNVKSRDCDGRTYSFLATRNGRSINVYVNARTGAFWRG